MDEAIQSEGFLAKLKLMTSPHSEQMYVSGEPSSKNSSR
jgi:hypothetical protein